VTALLTTTVAVSSVTNLKRFWNRTESAPLQWRTLGGWRIRPQQFAILVTLNRIGEASQQELCQALGIDSGNMVELVDGLETLGYAERRRDPRDRRRYLLELTEPGRAAFAAMTEAVDDYTVRFLEPLGQAEQAALVAALAKLFATTSEGRRMTWRPDSDRTVQR